MPPPGTAATPLPAAQDPIQGILSLLGTLGTGKITSETTPGEAASQQADQLIQSIQDSSSPEALSTLVQGILLKAKAALGPEIASTIASGARATSDSSLALIQGNAAARAAADSAAAILEAKNNANKLATQIASEKLQTSRKSTQQTGISPAGKGLIALSAIGQGKKLLGLNKTKATDTDNLFNPEGTKGTHYEEMGTPSATTQSTPSGTTDSGSVTDIIPGSETLLGEEGVVPLLGAGGTLTETGALEGGALEAGSGGTIIGGDTLAGGETLGEGSALTTAAESDSLLETGAEVGAAAWIICTELTKQGKMPIRYYIYGARAFAKYPEYGKQAYYVWAIPCVKHLKKYPNSLFSRFLEKIFNWRAEYLSAKQGLRGAKKHFMGLLVIFVTYSLCWIISRFPLNPINPKIELEKLNAN